MGRSCMARGQERRLTFHYPSISDFRFYTVSMASLMQDKYFLKAVCIQCVFTMILNNKIQM